MAGGIFCGLTSVCKMSKENEKALGAKNSTSLFMSHGEKQQPGDTYLALSDIWHSIFHVGIRKKKG